MKFLLLAAALLAAAPSAAANLVVNGNFSAGNTGFTSPSYTYVAPGNYGGAIGEALYAVDTDAFNTHFAWQSFADHTGDQAGLYMIVNGSGQSSVVWQQSVSVTANTAYNFSAFAANICCNAGFSQVTVNPSMLSLQANDGTGFVTLGSFTLSGVGTWLPTAGVYNNLNNTALTLRIINTNTQLEGNDFALDDISFSAVVPEPASWAMLVVGFGIVGASMRRRARVIAA